MSSDANKATIIEVAERAGVSVATVSRVFNHKGIVSQETCDRVIEAAEALNYQGNRFFRNSFITGNEKHATNDLIIINVPSISNPFYSKIVKGVQAAAVRYHCDTLISQGSIDESNVNTFIAMLQRVNAKGLIALNYLSASVTKTISSSIPVVKCCEYEENDIVSSVGIDDLLSTKSVMDYILSTGRSRIAFINGPLEYKYARQRRQGYFNAMNEAGININPNWVIQLPDISADMAFSSVAKLLSLPNPPDAFFTVSDVFAAAVVRAAQFNHYRIPEDIIVVGFDNIDISSITTPSITTVNQPKFQLGFLSCELLFERIANSRADVQHMLLNTELIIRESTTLPINNVQTG
jgi:LacI family repressor for deo operon, udp, cdd, tsx, nupC, and nupG